MLLIFFRLGLLFVSGLRLMFFLFKVVLSRFLVCLCAKNFHKWIMHPPIPGPKGNCLRNLCLKIKELRESGV